MSHAQSCECEFKSGATAAVDSREKDAYQAEKQNKKRERESLLRMMREPKRLKTAKSSKLESREKRKILEHS